MQRLDGFFSDVLAQLASNEELCLIFLKELWPQIVGNEVAQKTRPIAFRKQVLTLAAASPTWKSQLSELSDTLLEAVNRFWKRRLVASIRFEVSSGEKI